MSNRNPTMTLEVARVAMPFFDFFVRFGFASNDDFASARALIEQWASEVDDDDDVDEKHKMVTAVRAFLDVADIHRVRA